MAQDETNTEQEDSKRLTIEQAVEILIDRKEHGDHISCHSPDGLRFVHLRYYQAHPESDEHIKFMFKRCPEMKPYYAKIRAWFANNDLEWKEITIDSTRYMATILPLKSFLISDYAVSYTHLTLPTTPYV